MNEAKALIENSEQMQSRFLSWLELTAKNAGVSRGILSFSDLPVNYVGDVGKEVDVLTIRVPPTMPEAGTALYVLLASNIIAHAVELYGRDVFFTTSQQAQLRICRIIDGTIASFSVFFSRDGKLLRLSLYYDVVEARDCASSMRQIVDDSGLTFLQVLSFVVFTTAYALPLLSAAVSSETSVAKGGLFVSSWLFTLLLLNVVLFRHAEKASFGLVVVTGIFFSVLCNVPIAALNALWWYYAIPRDARGDTYGEYNLMAFGEALIAPIAMTAVCVYVAWEYMIAGPKRRRREQYIAKLRAASFQVRSTVDGEIEAYLSKQREHRNFFANMVDHIQTMRNMMQAASS